MSEKGSADDSRRNSWGVELGSMDRRTRFQVSKVMTGQSSCNLGTVVLPLLCNPWFFILTVVDLSFFVTIYFTTNGSLNEDFIPRTIRFELAGIILNVYRLSHVKSGSSLLRAAWWNTSCFDRNKSYTCSEILCSSYVYVNIPVNVFLYRKQV